MALWRIRATVDDRPGYLSVLTASLALKSVNILAVQVHTTEAGAIDDFLVDAPDALTEADLVAAVERGRGRNAWVSRTEARDLADQPTRALGLASRLVRDPDSLGDALSALLGADAVIWRPAPGHNRYGADRGGMRLADPAGGAYEISRPAPAFTPAEYARAQALVDLAATVVRQAADQVTLVLPDATEVRVRPAVADDLAAIRAMHGRCSPGSRQRRYLTATGHGAGGDWTEERSDEGRSRPSGRGVRASGASASKQSPSQSQLARLIDPARGVTLVALADDGRLVAMANLVAEGDLGEVAVLVEDAWQRRGLGTALLRRLVAHGTRAGYAALVAHTYADNRPMMSALRRVGRFGPVDRDGSLLTVTLPLSAASDRAEEPATA
ncbi:GNAT family N-acetyltransferase [Micromonospora sp. CPCC 205371]|nr:GNAT family N-acetyltransferase [Micromonospora sp. CPCC 205371]